MPANIYVYRPLPTTQAVAHAVCLAVGAAIGGYFSPECVGINTAWAAAKHKGEDTASFAVRYNRLFANLMDGWLG